MTEACTAPEGTVSIGTDCDDTRDDIYPGADEICGDGNINDCEDTDGSAALDYCSGSGPFPLTGADAELMGATAYDGAGFAIAAAWDVDGDGGDDLLVAMSSDVRDVATVYLVSGLTSETSLLSDAGTALSGDRSYSFGPSNTGVGDVDGDGFADLLLGANGGDRAYLELGPLHGDLDVASADLLLTGDTEDAMGFSVAGVGDADGDNLADLLIGAPSADSRSDGGADGCAADEDSRAGLDPGEDAGAAYLYVGPGTGTLDVSEAGARLYGDVRGNKAGWRVARAGDMDSDGLDDLYLSAKNYCNGLGAAYVVLSPVSGDMTLADSDAQIEGDTTEDYVGESLSGAGDTDGDGTPDLLVGDPDKDLSSTERLAGEVYLFLGPVSGTLKVSEADASLTGTPSSYAGTSMSSAGDIDLDGQDDLVIGAWDDDAGGERAGATYVLYGPLSGAMDLVDADTVFVGARYDYSGESVAGVGDVNADGLPDVLVGAFGNDDAATDAGAAWLLLGGSALLGGGGEI